MSQCRLPDASYYMFVHYYRIINKLDCTLVHPIHAVQWVSPGPDPTSPGSKVLAAICIVTAICWRYPSNPSQHRRVKRNRKCTCGDWLTDLLFIEFQFYANISSTRCGQRQDRISWDLLNLSAAGVFAEIMQPEANIPSYFVTGCPSETHANVMASEHPNAVGTVLTNVTHVRLVSDGGKLKFLRLLPLSNPTGPHLSKIRQKTERSLSSRETSSSKNRNSWKYLSKLLSFSCPPGQQSEEAEKRCCLQIVSQSRNPFPSSALQSKPRAKQATEENYTI